MCSKIKHRKSKGKKALKRKTKQTKGEARNGRLGHIT